MQKVYLGKMQQFRNKIDSHSHAKSWTTFNKFTTLEKYSEEKEGRSQWLEGSTSAGQSHYVPKAPCQFDTVPLVSKKRM